MMGTEEVGLPFYLSTFFISIAVYLLPFATMNASLPEPFLPHLRNYPDRRMAFWKTHDPAEHRENTRRRLNGHSKNLTEKLENQERKNRLCKISRRAPKMFRWVPARFKPKTSEVRRDMMTVLFFSFNFSMIIWYIQKFYSITSDHFTNSGGR